MKIDKKIICEWRFSPWNYLNQQILNIDYYQRERSAVPKINRNWSFYMIRWMRRFINLFCEIKIRLFPIWKIYKIICSRHNYLNLSDHEKTIYFIFSFIFVDTFPMKYLFRLRLVFYEWLITYILWRQKEKRSVYNSRPFCLTK